MDKIKQAFFNADTESSLHENRYDYLYFEPNWK